MKLPTIEAPRRWDIFCAVVDNYGDAAVCWRLARQLVAEHELELRLWIDDLRPLTRLCPGIDVEAATQHAEGVEVHRWTPPFPFVDPADVVIEAFACELPESYLAAMAARRQKPAWLNLEYLSAEDWTEACHMQPSPHPRLPLIKHFFFPGFTPKTGGLLRERDYGTARAAFDAAAFRQRLDLPPKTEDSWTFSLFGYDNPALPGLLDAWRHGSQEIECLVPEGLLLPAVARFLGASECRPGMRFERGALAVHVLPFVSQADYDRLLWLCGLNFVRGEDSFVRAQWAERPLVWHIYPQADEAHRAKLDAFLARYTADLPKPVAQACMRFWQAWNGSESALSWPEFGAALPALQAHAGPWARRMMANGDLAKNLVTFIISQRLAFEHEGR